ncbi:MAG: CoA transferase, partial [Candidatus Binatia bacterium]
IQDIFEDPHYQERGNLIEVDDPGVGRVRTQGVTPRLSETPGGVVRPAPTLGQHNQEIYCGLLGLSVEELEHLKGKGVI